MNKHELLISLISQNDSKLKSTEDRLIHDIDKAYAKAIGGASKEFEELGRVNQGVKANSADVKKILDRMIASFMEEFGALDEPFKKELSGCYEDALEETSLLLAAGEESE